MIYFVVQEGDEYVKIGFSDLNPRGRLGQCQTGNPLPLSLYKVIDGDSDTEAQLHKQFIKFHVRGEWFLFDPSLRKYIDEQVAIEGEWEPRTFDVMSKHRSKETTPRRITKKQITLRIDEDVVTWFKSKGKGYQSKMNDALRRYKMMNSPPHDVEGFYEDEDLSGASGSEDEFIEMKPIKLPKKDEIIPKLKKQIAQQSQGWRSQIKANPKQGKKAKK